MVKNQGTTYVSTLGNWFSQLSYGYSLKRHVAVTNDGTEQLVWKCKEVRREGYETVETAGPSPRTQDVSDRTQTTGLPVLFFGWMN